eukprot:scaffold3197_cov153-Skeletonema_menzelii.AAC.8
MKQLLFYVLWLQVAAAFQQSHCHYSRYNDCRHRQVATGAFISEHDEQFNDAIGRRVFARNSLLTLSILSIKPDNTLAETDDELASVTATPSTLEGELIVSSPPPNREIITDDEKTLSKPVTQVKKKAKASDPRFFIAGGASAAISHGITTPIDVVKTRMQSDTALSDISPSNAALRIVEAEGPQALTAGLGPTVIGYGVEGALKFGVYETLKPIFLSLCDGITDPTQPYLVAAICAGALASVVLCPMEETRIKLVTDPSFANGLIDGLSKIVKEEGILSPFQKGLAPMLSKQVPYTMGKQVSFDLFAGMLYGTLLGLTFLPKNGIALEVEVGAAFMASIVACLASHPGDVLLTATYKNSETSGNFFETIQRVYQDGGIFALFRGLNARFIHVGCIITFQLVIYDQIKQALGLPASGT